MPERTDRIDLTYTLIFESAFHCGSGLPRLLIDRAVRLDAERHLFVPGSTVKGALRDRCEQLAKLFGLTACSPHDEKKAAFDEYAARDSLSRLFGSRLYPGRLFIDDLKMIPDDRDLLKQSLSLQTSERTQVSLSRRTGVAKPHFLFSSEYGLSDLRFNGEICGYVSDLPLDENDDNTEGPTYALLLFIAGLMSLDRLGGNKSVGIGRCRTEIVTMKINDQLRNPKDWLEKLADLEYADEARKEAQL